MNEPVKIDCTGPASIIVPISEDLVTRFLFNDIVDRVFERNVQTQEELLQIDEIMSDFFSMLESSPDLANTSLPAPSPETREEFRKFHTKVLDQMDSMDEVFKGGLA